MFNFVNRHILVAGGNGLIGRSVCSAFLEQGAHVTVADLIPDGRGARHGVTYVDLDLAQPTTIPQVVDTIVRSRGPIDGLVVLAASRGSRGFFDTVEDYDLATWAEVLAVNLTGTFALVREVGDLMAQTGSGSITLTSSIYGSAMGVDQRIYPQVSAGSRMNAPAVYSASKGGIDALVKYLATYWGQAGIRVNAVAPGGVVDAQPPDFVRGYSARTPIGRMARPEEIAGTYVFLASEEASYVSGQIIYVDGGLSSW